jgi:hypothetical protein
MSTITPGYNFGVTERVTAAKLKSFVEGLTVAALDFSEVDDSIPRFALVSDTAFSLGPEGSMWYDTIERALWVQSELGRVILFKPGYMESRRFPLDITSSHGYLCGPDAVPAAHPDNPDGQWTLKSGTDGNPSDRIAGVIQRDLEGDTTLSGAYPRVCLFGITRAYGRDWDQIIPGQYAAQGGNAGQIFLTSSDSLDKRVGTVLGTMAEAESSSNWMWMWFWGKTLYRGN